MATFKHISSKNADYGAAEAYLAFEHDEFTMKPTLDENGRLIPREDYRISSLNCGDEDFAVACMRANLRYEKNQKREDVKSHHYIISFDPRDGTDNRNTFTQWYDGRDVPEEYRVTPQPQEKEQADLDAAAAIPTTATEQPPVLPIILSSEKTADKMKEITDRLEQGILGIYESDRYADYLRTMSKFHDYSLNNTILIAMQGGNLEERQLYTVDKYFQDEEAEPSYQMAGKEITPKLLLEAIRALPEERRKIVLLYYFEGLTDIEIGKQLNISRSTVQYRQTSSFEQLKKYLEENADEWIEW